MLWKGGKQEERNPKLGTWGVTSDTTGFRVTLSAAGTMGGTSKCPTSSPDTLSEKQGMLQCQEAGKDGHR